MIQPIELGGFWLDPDTANYDLTFKFRGGVRRVFGAKTDDYFDGSEGKEGRDIFNGFGGNDFAWGGIGNDILRGGNGNDILLGEEGNDRLRGGNGHDQLWGGSGDDKMSGGAGVDFFYFTKYDGAIDQGDDVITDFKVRDGLGRVDALVFDLEWQGQVEFIRHGKDVVAVFGDDEATLTLEGVNTAAHVIEGAVLYEALW